MGAGARAAQSKSGMKQEESKREKAAEICREYEAMAADRGTFDSHCEEIARRVCPSLAGSFQSRGQNRTEGEKRTEELFDSTAAIALGRFAAILDSLLTPRNQTWHRIVPSDSKLLKNRETRLWFEEANRLLFKYRYAPKANFASQNQQVFKGLGSFGNGAMFVDKLAREPGLRYRSIHIGELYYGENHQGLVDRAIRYFQMSLRQAAQRWGVENLPEGMRSELKANPEAKKMFLHCVKPREDVEYGRLDYRGMPFASYYVAMDGKQIMEEGGYTTFPYAITRYEQAPGEVYGRGPAMDVLPAIKTLNEEKKTVLKQGHRALDPVLLTHDDGVVDGFSMKPGAMNPGGVTADGRPLVHALPTGSIVIGKELMDDERSVINDAFLVTLFQILVETPQMTATEIMERTREKGVLLAPTVGRQNSEYQGPMIERELDLLAVQDLLPPMPQALLEAKGEYRIEYDSPLSRAQRAEEASGLMRTVEHALTVVNVTQNPEPLDIFDWDVILPEIAEINGVPFRWMASMEKVQSIRQGRAEAAQAQTAIQAAPGAAALVKSAAVANRGGR